MVSARGSICFSVDENECFYEDIRVLESPVEEVWWNVWLGVRTVTSGRVQQNSVMVI